MEGATAARAGPRSGRSGRLTASRSKRARARHQSVWATLFPVREVLLPWFVSRVYSAALIVTTWSTSAGSRGGIRLEGFTVFDGGWYLGIAHEGYGPPPLGGGVQTPWPFFPLLPGVIRGLSYLGISADGGIVAFNHVAFLLALAGLWRLAHRHVGPRAARLAVWSLALFPGAFIFSMIYPSAIFLAASVWAFLLVEERHDASAGLLVAAAALVRPNGIVVAVALVFAVRSFRRALIVCAPAVAAFGMWCVLCWYWTTNPLVFADAKNGWPELTILEFIQAPKLYQDAWPHVFLALAAIVAVLICRRRLPSSWIAFTALYLIPSLGLGMIGLGRYANEAFPAFVAAGEILHRTRTWLRVAAFGLAITGQAVCAWWVLHEFYIP